jgi:hypothetical protein
MRFRPAMGTLPGRGDHDESACAELDGRLEGCVEPHSSVHVPGLLAVVVQPYGWEGDWDGGAGEHVIRRESFGRPVVPVA